jgi:hypothetical protein
VERDLAAFVEGVRTPLAVRSSSLLEDSQHQPFTGVYDTCMLANDAEDPAARLADLRAAIQRVYASVFRRATKAYLRATSYRLEEEKMAVLVQQVVGDAHGERFYPDCSGVVRSHNFYPFPGTGAEDGVAAVALGLGRQVAEAGACVRFCPRYPLRGALHGSARELLDATQRGFWALPLGGTARDERMSEVWFDLDAAEADGTLAALASTYSPGDDTLSDGLARAGVRVVTLAPLLKHGSLPLAAILTALLEEAGRAVGGPVEIEFAVRLGPGGGEAEFAFLQLRPLSLRRESEALDLGVESGERVLCASDQVLGHGAIANVRDIVVVDARRFERARSGQAAARVGRLNAQLLAAGRPYLLIGMGRWGSRDPWLGIPVTWDQVCGAAAIVETGLPDVAVTPSQGSHFFHNLTSFGVAYFTVNPAERRGTVDWEWLEAQPAVSEEAQVRHLELATPLVVKVDGHRGRGVILQP